MQGQRERSGVRDTLASELEEIIDLIAERITTLGGEAMGTVRIVANFSILREYPFSILDGRDHVMALVEHFAYYAELVRTGIDSATGLGDLDTADIYTQVSRQIDKRPWFLEAHLQATEVSSAHDGAPQPPVATPNVR